MTDVGEVEHTGIKSDLQGPDGFAMVVHSSKRLRTAQETSMTEFRAGAVGQVVSKGYPSNRRPQEVLASARSQIGQPWSLDRNCEHFVSWAHGLTPTSPQLQATVVTGLVVAGLGALAGVLLAGRPSTKRRR
jgi:hypothetical protein